MDGGAWGEEVVDGAAASSGQAWWGGGEVRETGWKRPARARDGEARRREERSAGAERKEAEQAGGAQRSWARGRPTEGDDGELGTGGRRTRAGREGDGDLGKKKKRENKVWSKDLIAKEKDWVARCKDLFAKNRKQRRVAAKGRG